MAKPKKQFEVKNQGGIAKIKIIGDISWWRNASDEFTRMVDNLLEEGVTDVDGYINSPGGNMFEGNEIRNQFARFPGHKYVKLGALCASAATTISTVFDEIESSLNISYMIHDPMQSAFIQHEEDFESHKKQYIDLRNNAIKCYVNLSKKVKGDNALTEDEVSDMMRKTTWMNADELLEKGLIHKVDTEDDDYMPEDAQDVANRMKFSLPTEVLNKIKDTSGDEEEEGGEEGPPKNPSPKTKSNKNQIKMKQLIISFLATFNVVNVSAESSDENVVSALKSFVQQKISAFNSVVDQLKSLEGFKFNADNLVGSIKDFVQMKDDKIKELQGKLDEIDKEKLEAVYDFAKTKKGYTDEQVNMLKEMAKNSSVDTVVNFLDKAPDVKSLSQQVQKEGATNSGSTMAHAIYGRLAGIKNNLSPQSK